MAVHKTNISATWDVGVAIKRLSGYPLDLSQNHASETELKTYAKDNVTAYVGQLVNVIDSNGNLKDSYIIKDKAGNLKKLASDSDLSSLSGVFHFKGVAEAVSPDLSYIVTCSGKSDKSILSVGTSLDLIGDTHYGWDIEGDVFWTESFILNSQSTQYIRSEAPMDVWGVVYKNTFYYPDSVLPAGGDDEYIELKTLEGNSSIFIDQNAAPTDSGFFYDVYSSKDGGEVLGQGEGFSYTAYEFDEKTTPTNTGSLTYTTIQANEANSGHVYQIEENEYASNGTIWVKLGSPVEDWITL